MLQGGIADKLGNGYEARWTALESLRVLRGVATEIRLEPFNEDADGLEFRINANGIEEWHQCKRRRSSGSWTLKSLQSEKVLETFAKKLMLPNTKCVFVSSDPAAAFETLIEKAKLAETSADYYGENGLGKGDYPALHELKNIWGVSEETIHLWLKRCDVEVISEASLNRQLESYCDVLFSTSNDIVIPKIIDYLNANLANRITTEVYKEAIGSLGIDWLARLNETLDAKFKAATDEYLSSLNEKIGGVCLPIENLDKITSNALAAEKTITMVSGGAGSGKSVVLSEIISKAYTLGWPVLAFRIDRYLDIKSLEELGNALLSAGISPLIALGNRNYNKDTLLIIDQVDAVSDASGRSGRIRDLLFKMFNQSHHFPKMRIVAACRAYDMKSDTRIKQLAESEHAAIVELKALDWKNAIHPLLKDLGVDEKSLSDRSKAVLSVPINLQIFVKIIQSGENYSGEFSSTLLFDRLMEIRERSIRQDNLSWTAIEATGAIAQSMSDNQELTAPISILDEFAGAVDVLSSLGLITAIGGKLQFSHESFFDHVFSRHFVKKGQSVHGLLISDEQRLFRRTQVRQIFSRLREIGGRWYIANLKEVLLSPDIRYLVKDAVAFWLGEVDAPTDKELELAVELFSTPSNVNLAKIILNGKKWLPLIIEEKILDKLIQQDEETRKFSFWLLRKGASQYSELVEGYLRSWWRGNPEERRGQLLEWFNQLYPNGPIGKLEFLYAEIISTSHASEINEDFAKNFDLGTWVHNSGALSTKIFNYWLSTWMKVFPGKHPFGRDQSNNQDYWLKEMAKKYTEEFLDAIVPSFSEALQIEKIALASRELNYATIRPPHYEHDQEYVRQIIHALEKLASLPSSSVEKHLGLLGQDTVVGLYIHLKVIAANGEEFGKLLPDIAIDSSIFKIGEGDGDWIPFGKAANSAFPHLSIQQREKIEAIILSYRPEYDWAREYLRRSKSGDLVLRNDKPEKYILSQLNLAGQDQRAILQTIGFENLSLLAKNRLNELNRKFSNKPLPESRGIRGGFVRSPIPVDKARLMSDAQWLSAIEKYDNDDNRSYELDGVIGGARELSLVLQACAKSEPERFVAFVEKLSSNAKYHYAEAIVSSLREIDVSPELVIRAIKAAIILPRQCSPQTICWTVQKHPAAALDNEILDYLIETAVNGSASDTIMSPDSDTPPDDRSETMSRLLKNDGHLSTSGINGERGAAFEALANVLWDHENTLAVISDLLVDRAEHEALPSVLMCLVHTLNSLGKYRPELAIDLLHRLLLRDARLIQSHAAQHMIRWVIHRDPEVISDISNRLITSDTQDLKAQGYFLQSLLALFDEKINSEFVMSFSASSLIRKIAAYTGAANVSSSHHWEKCVPWLKTLFYDSDAGVRQETLHIRWEDVFEFSEDSGDFIELYIASPSFEDNSDWLMRALEENVSQYPKIAYSAVARFLDISSHWSEEKKRGHYSTLHHLTSILIELYQSFNGDAAQEEKILDLFDERLARDLSDVREEIGAYERH